MDGLSNLLNEAADAVAGLACVKTLPSEASVKMGELLNCFRTSQGIDNQREPYPLQFLEEWALAEEKFLLSAYPVTDAVATRQAKELEALGLLLVNREDRKYNIYKIPEYVSANTKITASKTEADGKTASVNDQTASIAWRLNQNNQSQPESSTTGVASQNCMSFYQNNIGMLTPIIADALQDAEATFGAVWVCEAIREAVRSEARSWKYCEAILKRWQRDGFKSQKQNGGTHAKSNSTNPDSPKPTETDLANARSVLAKRRAKAALPGV